MAGSGSPGKGRTPVPEGGHLDKPLWDRKWDDHGEQRRSPRAAADRPDEQLQRAAGLPGRTMGYPVSLSSPGGACHQGQKESRSLR